MRALSPTFPGVAPDSVSDGTQTTLHAGVGKGFLSTHNFPLDNEYNHLQQPILHEAHWEIDVPADSSCLFWAAACAYLIPVIDNSSAFQTRYLALFGEEKLADWERICNLFNRYNPFIDHQIFADPGLNSLVRETFRTRVIDYMAQHQTEFSSFWFSENNPLELSFDDHLSRMHDPKAWGGDTEIRAISQLLNCTICLETDTMPRQNFGDNPGVALTFRHVNIAGAESIAGNHYHFTLEKSIGDSYSQASIDQSAAGFPSPLLNAHPVGIEAAASFTKPVEKTNKIEKKANDENTLQIQQDKIADIKNLFNLHTRLESFLNQKNVRDATNQEEIALLLTGIAKAFSMLRWNRKSGQHIRNIYGKMNYKKAQKNAEYIDFGRIALLHTSFDQSILDKISAILFTHFDIFLKDIGLLSKNILLILRKEKKLLNDNKKVHAYVIKECQTVLQKLNLPITTEKLTPLNHFLPLLDIHYDRFFLQRLCQPSFLHALEQIDRARDPVRWRYTYARIFTIMGEAVKNLSEIFQERYSYLPLQTLTKLRDQLGHVHHKHIAQHNEDTVKLLLSISENDLPHLQKELGTILSAWPSFDGPHSALDTLQKYALPITDLLPKEVKKFINQVWQPERLTHLPPYQLNLLRSARINWIHKQLHTQSIEANKTPSAKEPFDKKVTDEKKYRNTIDRFKNRTDLTLAQNKALETAKKSLAFLESKRLPSAQQSIPQQNPKKHIDGALIKIELQRLEQELQTLRPCLHFYKLLKHFTKKKSVVPPAADTPDKLEIMTQNLEREIKRLKEFENLTLDSRRNYVKEHSIAVIGQLIRDIQEDNNILFNEVREKNTMIKQGFNNIVLARNQKVMHDPNSDNTPYLSSIILDDILPMLFDVQALKAVLHSPSSEEINNQTNFALMQIYTDRGCAYLRLNLLPQAEKYFNKAISHSQVVQPITLHKETQDLIIEEVFVSGKVSQHNRIHAITQEDDDIESMKRNEYTHLFSEAGSCQLRQNKFNLAAQYFQKALNIHCNDPEHGKLFLGLIQARLYVAKLRDNEKDLDALLPDIEKLAVTHYDSYVQVIIQIADLKMRSKNYEESRIFLNKIEFSKIVEKHVVIHFHTLDGLLLAAQANKIEQDLADQLNISLQQLLNSPLFVIKENVSIAFTMRNKAVNALKQAYAEFQKNLSYLKSFNGNHVGSLSYCIRNHLLIIMATNVVRYIHFPKYIDEVYTLMHEVIDLQKELAHNTSIIYPIMVKACYHMHEKTDDTVYLEEALIICNEMNQSVDLKQRAESYIVKATTLHMLKRIPETIISFLEGKFCYTQLSLSEKDNLDNGEEFLNTSLHTIFSLHGYKYWKVIKDYEDLGDQYKAENKNVEAIECYQKCQLGLHYVPLTDWQTQIEAKLSSLSTSAAAAAPPDLSASTSSTLH